MNIRPLAYLVLLALPAYGLRFKIFGIPTTALEIILFVVLILWLWKYPGLRQIKPNLSREWRIALGTLLLAATISVFVAPDFQKALGVFKAFYLEPTLFFLLLVSTFRGKDDALKLLAAAAVPGIVIAVFALLQRFGFLPIPAIYASELRVTSLYSYPNAVGLYLAPLIAACLVALVNRQSDSESWGWFGSFLRRARNASQARLAWRAGRGGRLVPDERKNGSEPGPPGFESLYLVLILLGIPSIIFSKTEAAWVALVATALCYGFAHKKLRHKILVVALAGMLALALTPKLAETTIGKLTLQDFSGAVRRTTWRESLTMLQDHALFGAGLAGYQTIMQPYHKQLDIEVFMFPHNILLNFWSELGLLGIIALFLLIRVAYLETRSLPLRWLALAPLLVMMVHGLFDVPFFKNDLAVLTFIFLALIPVLKTKKDQPSAGGEGSSLRETGGEGAQ